MQIGLFAFSTDYSMPIDQLAMGAEERGFDSIWLREHTHTSRRPGRRRTPAGENCPKNTRTPSIRSWHLELRRDATRMRLVQKPAWRLWRRVKLSGAIASPVGAAQALTPSACERSAAA